MSVHAAERDDAEFVGGESGAVILQWRDKNILEPR